MKRTGLDGNSASAAPAMLDATIIALKSSPQRAEALMMRSELFIPNSSARQYGRPELPVQNVRPWYSTGFIVLLDSWECRLERQAIDRTME